MLMDANYGGGFRPGAPTMGLTGAPPVGSGGWTERRAQPQIDPRHLPLLRLLLMHGLRSFAQGGIVTEPTAAVIGDAGPEAVVPLSGDIPLGTNPASRLPQTGNPWIRNLVTRNWQASRGPASDIIHGLLSNTAALGPDYLTSGLRHAAMSTADAMRHRTDVLSRLSGLDPMQQRGAIVNADIAANSDLANALNSAQLGGASSFQDFLRQLLTGERGYQFQTQQNALARQAARDAANQGFLGQVLGTAAGAIIPGRG